MIKLITPADAHALAIIQQRPRANQDLLRRLTPVARNIAEKLIENDKTPMPKSRVLVHYAHGHLQCDYLYVEVEIDGAVVQRYEGEYHDKGQDKAEAFLEGYALGARTPLEETEWVDIEDPEEEFEDEE